MALLTLNLNTRRKDGQLLVDIVVGNPAASRTVTIGNLNLANLKMIHVSDPNWSGSPWMSTHNPNTAGVATLGSGELLDYEPLEILREYKFGAPGEYRAWVIYDSIGFRERFEGATETCFQGLSQVEELRMCSDEIRFTLTDSEYQFNLAHVKRWVERADGTMFVE